MSKAHDGCIKLKHSFDCAYSWLESHKEIEFVTEAGTKYSALAGRVSKGQRLGDRVIRIFQGGKEYSRAYECCWGYYSNCNRTLVGMYCQGIDRIVK